MAFSLNAKISLIYLIVAPILLICLLIIANKAKPRFESVFKTYDELNNTVQENIRGIRVVKAFVQEDYEKINLIKYQIKYTIILLKHKNSYTCKPFNAVVYVYMYYIYFMDFC